MTSASKRKREEEINRSGDRFADKPTTQAAFDRLRFSRLVNFLADFIGDDKKRRTVTTIGIYGAWGSGKTSFLKLLDERLRNQYQIRPIWFYAWRYNKQDDLWAALLQSILNQAGKLDSDHLLRKMLVKFRLWRYGVRLGAGTWEVARKFFFGGLRIIAVVAILYAIYYVTFGVGGNAIAAFLSSLPLLNAIPANVQKLIVGAILLFFGAAAADVGKLRDLLIGDIQVDFTKFERKSNFRDHISLLDEFSEEFRDLLAILRPRNRPLVVIIDDLDRCLPVNALQVLESIKIFLDSSDCIFLLGLDRQVVEPTIAERYKEQSRFKHNPHENEHGLDAHQQRVFHLEYFDKIIPLAIAIPQLPQGNEEIEKFIRELNKGEEGNLPDPRVEACADIFGFTLYPNPRKVKRILRSFCFVCDLVEARITEQEAYIRKQIEQELDVNEKDIPEKAIRHSLLAKLILIQFQFPDFYDIIIKQPSLLIKLETYYRNPDKQAVGSEAMSEAESYAKEYQGLREILVRGKDNEEDSFVDQDIHLYIYQIGTLAEVGPSIRRQAFKNEIFWNIPDSNELFIAREDILRRLRHTFAQRLASHDARIVLTGLGGSGKTQIAIEYAHRCRQDYKAVFWVHAETRDMLITDYAAIAEFVNLPEKNERDQNRITEAVKTWLERQTNCLLILDSANDIGRVSDLLPSMSNGHILLTTRQQNVDNAMLSIPVDSLAAQEGELLLLRRAKIIGLKSLLTGAASADREQAREIVQMLGGLPLALDQAGAYIEETHCGLQGYLERYRSGSNELLKKRGGYDADHPESVAMTWLLSLRQIKEEAPNAASAAEELLQLCALMAPDEIPIELFRGGAAVLQSIFGPVADFERQLDAALQELEKFSFVRRNADGQTLSIHRLVQTIIQDEMDQSSAAHEQANKRPETHGTSKTRLQAERVILLVSRAFPAVVDFTRWKECQRYLTQALACADLVQRWKIQTSEAAQLLDRTGQYLRERAQYSRAEELLQSALIIRTSLLGSEHPDTLATLNALALLYQAQRRYAEAEELMLRVQQIYEKKQEPLDIATSLSNLASLYNAQFRYTDAEPLLRRALETRQKQLGEDDPDIATTKSELGLICLAQSRYDEAESLLKSALDIRQRVLKEDDPDVATTKSILADLYQALSRYNEAEPLLQEALTIREKALGKDHADVAITLSNLATLYYEQARYEEAEPLFKQALNILKKLRKEDDPDVAAILNNLGRLYYNQARYKESEPLIKQALDILQKALEEDDSQLIAIQWLYVSLLRQVKKEQEAAALEKHIRQIQESAQQERG